MRFDQTVDGMILLLVRTNSHINSCMHCENLFPLSGIMVSGQKTNMQALEINTQFVQKPQYTMGTISFPTAVGSLSVVSLLDHKPICKFLLFMILNPVGNSRIIWQQIKLKYDQLHWLQEESSKKIKICCKVKTIKHDWVDHLGCVMASTILERWGTECIITIIIFKRFSEKPRFVVMEETRLRVKEKKRKRELFGCWLGRSRGEKGEPWKREDEERNRNDGKVDERHK